MGFEYSIYRVREGETNAPEAQTAEEVELSPRSWYSALNQQREGLVYTNFISEKHKNVSGIYGIFDRDTGCCLYVGQTKCFYSRKIQHIKKLRLSTALRSFSTWYSESKSDSTMLIFVVLSVTDDVDVIKNEEEIYWFEYLKPVFYGKKPSTKDKWSHSDETKNKIRSGTARKYIQLVCHHCGESFTGVSSKYCSSICRYKNNYVPTNNTSKYSANRGKRIDRNLLMRLYVDEQKSARQVAKETGFSEPTVRKQLKEQGVQVRSRELQLEISRTL